MILSRIGLCHLICARRIVVILSGPEDLSSSIDPAFSGIFAACVYYLTDFDGLVLLPFRKKRNSGNQSGRAPMIDNASSGRSFSLSRSLPYLWLP